MVEGTVEISSGAWILRPHDGSEPQALPMCPECGWPVIDDDRVTMRYRMTITYHRGCFPGPVPKTEDVLKPAVLANPSPIQKAS